jgi:hypothetical protein
MMCGVLKERRGYSHPKEEIALCGELALEEALDLALIFVRITKGAHYRAPARYVKTWSVVLLNKKIHILLSQVYCV